MSYSEFVFLHFSEGQVVILSVVAVVAYLAALLAAMHLIEALLNWRRMRRALSEEELCRTMSPSKP